jgi:TetR/AcrR family transcriptional repressor of nem operon
MQVFWEKGYEATSVQDLVDRMGINRFSLYDTFGDKHALFLAALDRYCTQAVSALVHDMERADAGIVAIHQYFRDAVGFFASRKGWQGFLMTNTMVECSPHDPEVAMKVQAHLERLETAFTRALGQAQAAGELQTRQNTADLARFLAGSAVGLQALAKTSPGRKALEGYTTVVLSVLV